MADVSMSSTVSDARKGGELVEEKADKVLEFKKRMLAWGNPVEYVNNMYGCHPDDQNNDYFKSVFRK